MHFEPFFLRVDPLVVPGGGVNLIPLLFAAREANLEVLKVFKEHPGTVWTVESSGNNVLAWLLMEGQADKEKQKKCLKWLREDVDPDFGDTINMIGSSGSTVLAAASQFDWGLCCIQFLDQIIMQYLGEGDEEKDLMIGWLLSKGANITSMEPDEVENYLDRSKSSCVGDRFILLIPVSHVVSGKDFPYTCGFSIHLDAKSYFCFLTGPKTSPLFLPRVQPYF